MSAKKIVRGKLISPCPLIHNSKRFVDVPYKKNIYFPNFSKTEHDM